MWTWGTPDSESLTGQSEHPVQASYDRGTAEKVHGMVHELLQYLSARRSDDLLQWDVRIFNYDMFDGVNYEVSISKEPGKRIENLTWPDGSSVEDDDVFDIAVNNYRAKSQLLSPGEIFEEDDMSTLLEMDVRGDIGGVRELIGGYIENVKDGSISPECNNNWKLTGYEWDPDLHQKAVEMAANGEIISESSQDGRTSNIRPITEADLS